MEYWKYVRPSGIVFISGMISNYSTEECLIVAAIIIKRLQCFLGKGINLIVNISACFNYNIILLVGLLNNQKTDVMQESFLIKLYRVYHKSLANFRIS